MPTTIARYFEPSEAHIVRALLESAGFSATVADEHHVTANYPLSTALGGVRVQVPDEQAGEALALVAAYTSGELERELELHVGEAAPHCPACGSEDIRRRVPGSNKLLAVAVFLAGSATFPTRESLCECVACQHQWERLD
ncbi:DUF2007 domain-containing protein [Arenimonas sp.]|uniref:putative signal transducing protein n=1 Tax=Arenimonas sp. TaxID=1872635 RepID=UPI0025FD1BDE|nr:DUF2007 domain-containing protein [Arenimonas sp.]